MTALAWRSHRPDLQPLALGLAALMLVGGMAAGFVAERRRLRVIDAATGLPARLVPLLDLKRYRFLPLPSPPPATATASRDRGSADRSGC